MDSAFMYSWRDREHILDMLEMISGNRVNYGIPTIGGVRRDIPSSKIPQIFKILNHIGRRGRFYAKLFHSDMLARKRFSGKGILTKDWFMIRSGGISAGHVWRAWENFRALFK